MFDPVPHQHLYQEVCSLHFRLHSLALVIQILHDGHESIAKTRKITPDRLHGQTFTVSNIGAVRGGHGTPIIPFGTTAILSVGRADPKPVIRDGSIAIAAEFPLSLSYDHRVIDGAMGRAFSLAVIAAIEGYGTESVR
ncbi:MAG TPA: hypothetical protein DEO92_00205 [Phycisphaerales bacterium]|nr:hypothetical protein [Phycisphaerales bacterium]